MATNNDVEIAKIAATAQIVAAMLPNPQYGTNENPATGVYDMIRKVKESLN